MESSEYTNILHQWSGLRSATDLAETDGFICGLVTRGGSAEELQELLFTDSEMTPEILNQCHQVLQLRSEELLRFDEIFQPLIVDEDSPLADRTDSLAAWCYGFLATLGDQQPLRDQLSDDSFEALHDLEQISQATSDDENELEEEAFYELHEYVRVAASLIVTELVTPRTGASMLPEDETLH